MSMIVRRLFQVLASILLVVPVAFSAASLSEDPGDTDASSAAVPPRLFPRSGYSWTYSKGPVYGDDALSNSSAPGILRLDVGSFDLVVGDLGIPVELTAPPPRETDGPRHFVLQLDPAAFADGRLEALEETVKESGGSFERPLSSNAWIVRLDPRARALAAAQPGVLALVPYHPAFKLSPMIGLAPLADPDKALSDRYEIDALVFPGSDTAALSKEIAALGGRVLSIVSSDSIHLEIHRDLLAAIAALEPIDRLFEHLPVYPLGEETTQVVQTGGATGGLMPYLDAGINGGGVFGTCSAPNAAVSCQSVYDCPGSSASCSGGGPAQVLMVLDNGFQLDAGDLSNSRILPGPGRKVISYTALSGGDLLGCDANVSGASTHGHLVAATALGQATKVGPRYGGGWTVPGGGPRALDGVAPAAQLVAYDAQVTPAFGGCADPIQGTLSVGDLYTNPSSGSLPGGYTQGARISDFSWGTLLNPSYGTNATKVDQFLTDYPESMVVVAAGNQGTGGSISDPATAKNSVSVGATYDLNTGTQNQDARWPSSSKGPATSSSLRVAPILMAPGADYGTVGGNLGNDSELACTSSDNDQAAPVECAVSQGHDGTSFSAAAVSGAAMLVRDYLRQGYYPDGQKNPANQISAVSGALVKAILVASADWVGAGNALGANLTAKDRFNNEQGYGRVQLDNVLPLKSWAKSPTRMIVSDGGVVGGRNDTTLPGSLPAGPAAPFFDFQVCSSTQELRVALAWIDPPGDSLVRDLDLRLVSPTSRVYRGNAFRDTAVNDCKNFVGINGGLDASPWSLRDCPAALRDTRNPTEAIFLSPDPIGNGVGALDNQIETGTWRVFVEGNLAQPQKFALVISGGVCSTSISATTVTLDQSEYACNGKVRIRVMDPTSPSATTVRARTTVERISGSFLVGALTTTPFFQTSSTVYDSLVPVAITGAADGEVLRVTYKDGFGNSRIATAVISCKPKIDCSEVKISQLGRDDTSQLLGGCEKSTNMCSNGFGNPDPYLDPGENAGIRVAFRSLETIPLTNVTVTLTARTGSCAGPPSPNVIVKDSPKTIPLIPAGASVVESFALSSPTAPATVPSDVFFCLGLSSATSKGPGVASCSYRRTLDADQISFCYSTDFPGGATEVRDFNNSETATDPNAVPFAYRYDSVTWSSLTATNRNLGISSPWNFEGSRDGFSVGLNNTSTHGIVETIANWGEDQNFNGILDYVCSLSPATSCPGTFPAACACGRCSNNSNVICCGSDNVVCGGGGTTCNPDAALGTCQSLEDRDPFNGVLDDNWSTAGGCGWQTNGTVNQPAIPGGVWHTGRIGNPGLPPCLVFGQSPGACQAYEIFSGTTGTKSEWELLLSPVVEKVNQCNTDLGPLPGTCSSVPDTPTSKVFTVEMLDWGWNMTADLRDNTTRLTWELDNDLDSSRIDLVNDADVLGFKAGPWGPVTSIFGGRMFAPVVGGASQNDTNGNNRVGRNACYVEQNPISPFTVLAKPPDDGIDQNGGAGIDEFVTQNGPIRNWDMNALGSFQPPKTLFEDQWGDSGSRFQAAVGFHVREGNATNGAAQTSFGVTLDDMVLQWREYKLGADTTGCASGQCAVVLVDQPKVFQIPSSLGITVIDQSADVPCNTTPPATVPVTVQANCSGCAAKTVTLNQVSPGIYRGSVFLWNGLFGTLKATNGSTVTAKYLDQNDGTCNPCGFINSPAALTVPGQDSPVESSAEVEVPTCALRIKDFRIVDSTGDGDGFADTSETASLYVTVVNDTGHDLPDVTAFLQTDDPKIDCILQPMVSMGPLAEGETKETPVPLAFRVTSTADRAGTAPAVSCTGGQCTNGAGACSIASDCTRTASDDYSALFSINLAADGCSGADRPQALKVDLDLNASSPALNTTTFTDGFEAGFGNFTLQNLDFSIASNTLSNGYRCASTDPDNSSASSFGEAQCYLGFAVGQSPVNDWHVHTTAASDGGRAYIGLQSLHYGKHLPGNPNRDTIGLSQLDAIRTKNNLNLAVRVCAALQAGQVKACNSAADCTNPASACVSSTPVLSFKQQVSMTDPRADATADRVEDRAVVQVQLGTTWRTLQPYANVYDSQVAETTTHCMFDPIDDGNDEDSLFSGSSMRGASSTCAPGFSFGLQGSTDYAAAFDPDRLGRAQGPALPGSVGGGTWVEPRFSLDEYRGRQVRFRFLATTHKEGDTADYLAAGSDLHSNADDGWYIDDVRVTQTLGTSPATVTADSANNGALPGCGPTCSALSVGLTVDPSPVPAPGQVVTLTAGAVADRCVNGFLEFRFWLDVNGNGIVGDVPDLLLRDWLGTATHTDAPATSGSVSYGVEARCSSAPAPPCLNQALASVTVECPSCFGVRFTGKTALNGFTDPEGAEVIRGDLTQLRANGGDFNPTVLACIADDTISGTATDGVNPAVGTVFYYLARHTIPSNTWSTFSPKEVPGANGTRDFDLDGPPKAANSCSSPP